MCFVGVHFSKSQFLRMLGSWGVLYMSTWTCSYYLTLRSHKSSDKRSFATFLRFCAPDLLSSGSFFWVFLFSDLLSSFFFLLSSSFFLLPFFFFLLLCFSLLFSSLILSFFSPLPFSSLLFSSRLVSSRLFSSLLWLFPPLLLSSVHVVGSLASKLPAASQEPLRQ